jgi:hypothetical protein
MRLLLLVPDGVGLRTFLCTSFADQARERATVDVWHALPPAVVAEHEAAHGGAIGFHPLPVRREPVAARVLRTGKRFAPLYSHREPGTEKVLVSRSTTPVDRVVHRSGQLVGRAAATRPSSLPALERLHARAALPPRHDVWSGPLAELHPDVVLCTHQRAGVAVPPMVAARRLGIPTATFIHSWDNLPKGRMAVWPDHVLVWSQKMADDLLRYQPDLTSPQVHVVGTPQLEPHLDASLAEERAPFLRRLGLDPDRPVVLWSGADLTTSPADPAYLDDLACGLERLPGPQSQLLLRRSPADLSGRYDAVLAAHPEIVVSDPEWITTPGGGWDSTVPRRADVALLANVARHCDVVVNLGSTMAMDFAAAGRPAVFVAYEQPGLAPRDWRAADIYRLPHFASVHQTDPVAWVHRREDFGAVVARALADPAEHAAGRQAWLDLEVAQPLSQASARCLDALECIAASRPGVGAAR